MMNLPLGFPAPLPPMLVMACLTASACTSSSRDCEKVGTSDCGRVLEQIPSSVTQWAPAGARTVGTTGSEVIPEPNAFHAMHVGPNNSDNIWVAVAPQLELDWVAETSFFVPEGPTYDNQGNLYFSPLFPQENVSLVS
ncbi:MAG: hypothetical protein AAF602_22970, partial [Myxococcota bacterium]